MDGFTVVERHYSEGAASEFSDLAQKSDSAVSLRFAMGRVGDDLRAPFPLEAASVELAPRSSASSSLR